MLKVLHMITDLSMGGTELALFRLLRGMNRDRIISAVVSITDDERLAPQLKAVGIPVFTLGMKPSIPDPRGLYRLVALLRRFRPHILQTWLYHADLLGLFGGRLAGVPTIAWNVRCSYMEMGHYSPLSRLVRWLLVKLSSFPEAVVVNSEAGRQFHDALGYRPRKWVLIRNGFDLDEFRPNALARAKVRWELGVREGDVLIGFVARYDPMKDHETFLEAARVLLGQRMDARFVLVGKGVGEGNGVLMSRISALGLYGKVHLLGEREDIPMITAALDIATCCSLGEGLSNTVGEAMSCGVPCVVTDVGDLAWLVGDTGLVVPPKKPKPLATAWRDLIAMGSEQRVQLGTAARKRITEHFSLSSVTAQYEALYEALTRN